ncbi:MAG: dephospho-CoA kinase [Pseudomonadota bacterium]|nr:dephospho-CoA kinase [Pseudomonadota bacterium]
MKILGLTGSIGMGKTHAMRALRRMHLPVFDADETVHALLESQAISQLIGARFPECLTREKVDRRALGDLVFSDRLALEELEGWLHPLVAARIESFLTAQRRERQRIVVLDVPLLFETGMDSYCDAVICVTAPSFVQHARVLRRTGMNAAKLDGVLTRQMPDRDKCRYADYIVHTGGHRGDTWRHLRRIVADLRE